MVAAASILTDEPWTPVNVMTVKKNKTLSELLSRDDDDEPCSTGSTRTNAWKGYKPSIMDAGRPAASWASFVVSTIPLTTMTGTGTLGADAIALCSVPG